jgi:ketosteroid isomerase-like protein
VPEELPEELHRLGEAGRVLERFRAAAIAQSAADMERLYAVDAVHEFPFTTPGVPGRLVGRDAVMKFVVAGWKGPLRYERYRTLSAWTTDEPGTVVVQQEVHGTSATTGPFVLPNLVVLTVADGEIRHLRDFVNLLAAFDALGQRP